MEHDFFRRHITSILVFTFGAAIAVLFFTVPAWRDFLSRVDQLGYPGMLLAGVMYGSALTSSLATIIFIDTPLHLHLVFVGLVGGLGAALYDLALFWLTRREASHGWLASVIARIRERRNVPNWLTLCVGTIILASPLPDELAAGLFGINNNRATPFFLLSFASNALGVFIISGMF